MNYSEIVSKMTTRQKAEFMSGKDFWQSRDLPEFGVPSLFLADGPNGLRKQAAAADHLGLNPSVPATCFPTAATMANSWNPALGEELADALGEEAAVLGVNVVLGPGINMKRNPLCGRNFEYFSEDPYLAGKMGAAYIRGIQKRGAAACVKHYAANNQEFRRMVIDTVVDERTLREIYLTAFEIAVKEGKPHSVMSSYNKIKGVHVNENMHLMQEILREEWGFPGVVVTDWAGCNDRVAGIKAGNELEMPACAYGVEDIVEAVESGALLEAELDACVVRLLELVEKVAKPAGGNFSADKHHEIAAKCAEESVVLLKNDGTLPLEHGEKVAFIGDFAKTPRFQGAGSSIVNPIRVDTALSCAKDCGLHVVGFAKGFDRFGKKKKKWKREALTLAQKADLVVYFMGLDEVSETEGIDRTSMKLPQNQVELLAELSKVKKVIVVLSCGSAVEMDWEKYASGLVHSYLGGQAGASAALKVISGEICPGGKLAESIPYRYEDCPTARYFPGRETSVEYREGPFIGYRYYGTANVPVRYPFGFGLSYTSFSYADLAVGETGVSFTVTNTGTRRGAETAQLYIGKDGSALIRPKRELKGFAKIFLEAGESKTVEIPFDDKTFRYFDTVSNRWETEGGIYRVEIGASSEDIRLAGEIVREGAAVPSQAELPHYRTADITNVPDAEFANLLGYEPPVSVHEFPGKRKRKPVHYNSTVEELRYAPGWVGRTFAFAIRFAIRFLRLIKKRASANTLVMGVQQQPMRGLAKFGGFSRSRMDGMIEVFNGRFFRGLKLFFRRDKKKSKMKAERAQ